MLTKRQRDTLNFIRDYFRAHKIAPTIAEIAQGLSIRSRTTVFNHIQALAAAQIIKLLPDKRRNIVLLEDSEPSKLFLMGAIACGQPLEIFEDAVQVDLRKLLARPNRFMLRVKGDSMIGDHIQDGDLVIAEKVSRPRSNQIVIALIDNQEATLKRIRFQQDGSVALIPSNDAHPVLYYDPERVAVQGVLVGVIRSGDFAG